MIDQDIKEMLKTFFFFFRKFDLHLKKDVRILSAGFRVFAIDKDSNARRVDMDVTNIYHGYVSGMKFKCFFFYITFGKCT